MTEISCVNDGKLTIEIFVPKGATGIFDYETSLPMTFKNGKTAVTAEPIAGRITFELGEGSWTVE